MYKEEVELYKTRATVNLTPVGVIASVTHHTYYIQQYYILLGLRPICFKELNNQKQKRCSLLGQGYGTT